MLSGKRILVVEDEPLIALDLETAIVDLQGCVVGPAGTLYEAMKLAREMALDGAILDLRLREGLALSVAEQLRSRSIPFVIHSGQAELTLPGNWPKVPVISKPALPEHVVSVLANLMRR